MHQIARLVALLTCTTLSIVGAVDAAGFNQFIIFGDSTLDTGYFRYYPYSGNPAFDSALTLAIDQGATGGFAGNGTMNTVMLAEKFGLTAKPVNAPGGGTNYANGGATTIDNPSPDYPNNVTTCQQITNYLSSVNGAANSQALYLIKTGDNDATYVTNQGQAWIDANPSYLDQVAAAMASSVASLQAAGARTIVVRNSYDSAILATTGGTIVPNSSNAAAYARAYALGVSEWTDIHAAGVNFIPADNDSLFKYVVQHPYTFGFTPYSVLSSSAPYYTIKSAALCILTPAEQSGYLFIDGVHLTTAGQTIEADYTYSLLTAPGAVSLLAESPVQGNWGRLSTIQGQIETPRECRGPSGRNVWFSSGAYNSKISNGTGLTGDSGTPIGGAVGIDYQTEEGLIVGAAFSAGSQTQDFTTGGYFNQVDEAPSLYLAYKNEQAWGNIVMSCDFFQDKISRPVPLGIFTDQNNGKTNGVAPAIALRGGYDFSLGNFLTGPVFGMVLQEVRVSGFTETGETGVTALSFDAQTRDSFVTQLGWRVSAGRGNFHPFAEMNWNHECAGRDRSIKTTLTSTNTAPSYTMDAIPVASDWATLSLGTYYQLSPRVILRGAASSVFINTQMINCGGDLGLNFSF